MARPVKIVDESRIIELAAKGHSFKGIAIMLGVSYETIHRRYAEACDKGRELMRTSLLAKQYDVAMGDDKNKPNAIMLIWLGKQHLGQADKQDIDVTKHITAQLVVGIESSKLSKLTQITPQLTANHNQIDQDIEVYSSTPAHEQIEKPQSSDSQ